MVNEQNLKPFTGADDPRRGKKPKGVEHSRTRMRRLLDIVEKMKNPVTGEIEDFSVLEQIDMILISQARKGNLKAMRELLDRVEGRPTQGVDVTSGGKPIPILGGLSSVQPDDSDKEAVEPKAED